ncbi:MAG: phage terminase large subunit [Hyphomonadaceae bacterium]|nr:phage terminase large subunit [Hyphomonadaceae bacterium]
MRTDEGLAPTPMQAKTLAFRQHCNILNAGGRGSGKSFGFLLDIVDHCRDFGADARPLVVRESWAGLQEIGEKLLAICIIAFGPRCSRNKADGTIALPNGAIITLSNIADEESFGKVVGRSFSALFADEAGNYPPQTFRFMQRIRSNLRVAPGRRAHIHMTCNPHGRSHTVIFKNYVSKAPAFTPFQDDQGVFWIIAHSTYRDNPHIDRVAYEKQLRASCGGDEALLRAWLDGDWNVLGGQMFDCFDTKTHLREAPRAAEYQFLVGADYGSASPSAAILLGRLKSDYGSYRTGDIFAIKETDTALPNDLSSGDGSSIASWASQISEMLRKTGVRRAQVVTDDARGLSGDTVVKEMQACGLPARKPYAKNRVAGWILLRSLLSSASVFDGRPALWISPRECPHLVETLCEAPRGTLRAEDLDPKWDRDHWLDALVYGVTALHKERGGSGTHTGMQ